ncbi:hypothetical protein M422DRAFT_29452 [Sphaerobolus stellatus SS14]|uniref:N-acetyltransferase domain-containing protein n=1 Tax=Sphaerobolus stellatus (strain SS14) TaxID=990650 RepID=A0A0C9W2Z0_SPHS4|nr:hypothetical protein M422DRAFT_29452 [Sphaerobolus stellatus SS14]
MQSLEQVTIRKLENPTESELEILTNLLCDGFTNDPFFAAATGGIESLRYPYRRTVIAAAAIDGEIYVAKYGDRDFVGVISFFPPDKELYYTEAQREACGFNALFASYPVEVAKWYKDYFFPIAIAHDERELGKGVGITGCHIVSFAVLPEFQGKAIGKALIKRVESEAFNKGTFCYLFTHNPINVAIYNRLGYTPVGEPQRFVGLNELAFHGWIFRKNAEQLEREFKK